MVKCEFADEDNSYLTYDQIVKRLRLFESKRSNCDKKSGLITIFGLLYRQLKDGATTLAKLIRFVLEMKASVRKWHWIWILISIL